MEILALNQLTTIANISSLIIINENKEITKVDCLILKEYENYQVIRIDTYMTSDYNDMFKTTTVQSYLRAVIRKVNA
jgi:hypothetical protein